MKTEQVHCPCHAACEKKLGETVLALQALARQYRDMLAIGGFTGREPQELRDADTAIDKAKVQP